ncbi:MAG: hypothetical protein Q7R73_02120 [bacterium]|nr:hypothetical protein [bacterium]
MVSFLSFFFLLFFSFLFEQSVVVPLGLSPGVFFVPFFVYISGLFFLERKTVWWFVLCGGMVAGIFSVSPLFSFLLFMGAGVLFLFAKLLLPVERMFSFVVALWFGILFYAIMLVLLWSSARFMGFFDAVPFSSLVSSLTAITLFAFGFLIPVSVVWWLLVYRKRNTRSYMLR